MLYIRADGNKEIGMGHIMRCLSIADAAKGYGIEAAFLLADDTCCTLIKNRGFQTIVLGTDYRDMLSELGKLAEIVSSQKDMILVDSYQVSAEYYRCLMEITRVACLEDMGEAYPVDLLINYNIYAPKLQALYEAQKAPKRILLGTKYLPLRKDFLSDTEYEIKEKVRDVLITTGGSDPFFISHALMEYFSQDAELVKQEICWHILSGPFNIHGEKLKSIYGKSDESKCFKVVIHENVQDMKTLLKSCDIVLSATGSTIYEVSSLGVPLIVFYFAENQRQFANALGMDTEIANAGCFTEDSEMVKSRALKALKRCIADNGYRKRLHEQEKELVDSNGAKRIVQEFVQLLK